MDIKIGTTYTADVVVTKENVARSLGSGLIDVFATPSMITLMEWAATKCIEPHLGEGQSSVGTAVNVSHSSATPIGMRVTATATVTAVDRRRVDFDVIASDECGEIGRGTHSRFVIDMEPFMAKTNAKGK